MPLVKTISPALFARYVEDPKGCDAEVRAEAFVPDNKYYTVSVWPLNVAGQVRTHGSRVVKGHKVSKSDQPN